MDTTTSSSESRCKNPSCERQLPQRASSGHRQREYCDDTCRQAARRVRLEETRREQCVEQVCSWGTFQPATVDYLACLLLLRNTTGARRLAALIASEQGQAPEALRERPRRAILTEEQAHERAELHGYLDEGIYLASTQRLFVRLFQADQIEPNEMREAIHQERGAATDRHRQRIAELEQELANTCEGRDQVQERFRAYVETTNERVGNLCGELAALRQERERSAKPKPLAKGERQELEQARADLLRLYQERARGSEEIHRLTELAQELQMRLGAAHHRIAELESSKRDSQAEPLCLDEEQAAGQEEQHTGDDCREKLLRLGERASKLERQVETQRQMIAHYHARFYPSSLAVATQKLMALGAAMNYRILLKYDAQAVEVPPGETAWREFATHASYEEVAQAILQATYLFDNLFALGMVGKRDNQAEPD